MLDPTTVPPVPVQMRILGLFAKAWDPGRVKTRLAKTLGDETAATIYKNMLCHHMRKFHGVSDRRTVVAYSPDCCQVRDRFATLIKAMGVKWHLVPQSGGDLGTRMREWFHMVFKHEFESAIIIGSDAPSLTNSLLDEAYDLLKKNDVVFGPSTDGGYYLVGLSRMVDEIFNGIQWSTEQVLKQSMAKCESAGLSVATTRALTDIDDESDLLQEIESLESSSDIDCQHLAKSIRRILSECP